jgi:putative restriction endonuclease
METRVPVVWFVGVGHRPGGQTQVFQPIMPVWLIAEERDLHQFVVALEPDQRLLVEAGSVSISEVERRYNFATAKRRLHQPIFRSRVIHAYQRRCAVCRLPFEQLLDAAHIKSDAEGGSAAICNGLALCKIHHGAFDANLLGISPDYRVRIKNSVLETFDGPTLQHALKEIDGAQLAQIPTRTVERPDRDLLDERYQRFLRHAN